MSPARPVFTTVVASIGIGNLAILAAHLRARRRHPPSESLDIRNGWVLDQRLSRSGGADEVGYQLLADLGVRTIVDLRAEGGGGPAAGLGMDVVSIPIRDGQAPGVAAVEHVIGLIRTTEGRIHAHCSAGVGRTGSLLAAIRVLEHGWAPRTALAEMLAVGPPSLEQISFVLGLDRGLRPPHFAAVVVSRVLDGPRRTFSRLKEAVRTTDPV